MNRDDDRELVREVERQQRKNGTTPLVFSSSFSPFRFNEKKNI